MRPLQGRVVRLCERTECITPLQWHPYSLTSGPNANPGKLVFHVKEAGDSPDSWTKQVVKAGRAGQLKMRIDAFYGDYSDELSHKKAVVLVGGGIGITPMMSLAMDLVATKPSLPVTLLWVCRTVQEFEILSSTLYTAKNRHKKNLTVKVWITLGLPEPKISRESVLVLISEQEKCSMVLSATLGSRQANVPRKRKRRRTELSLSKITPRPRTPRICQFMRIAMIFALFGYTTAVGFSRNRGVEREGIWTLMNMSFVMGMVLVTFLLVLLARPLFQSEEKRGFEVVFSSSHDQHSDNNNHLSSAQVNLTDTEICIDDSLESGNNTYRSMLEGRIGCRPNMKDEFRELAALHHRSEGNSDNAESLASSSTTVSTPFDAVGVLACGPKAMTNAINETVHNAGPFSTFWDAGKIKNKDGTDATFAFVEEDWEW